MRPASHIPDDEMITAPDLILFSSFDSSTLRVIRRSRRYRGQSPTTAANRWASSSKLSTWLQKMSVALAARGLSTMMLAGSSSPRG